MVLAKLCNFKQNYTSDVQGVQKKSETKLSAVGPIFHCVPWFQQHSISHFFGIPSNIKCAQGYICNTLQIFVVHWN